MTVLEGVLLGVVSVLAVLACGYGGYRTSKFLSDLVGSLCELIPVLKNVQATAQNLSVLTTSSVTATGALAKALEASREDAASVPKLVAGLTRVCEAHVIEVGKLREQVREFSAIVKPPNEVDTDLPAYSEEAAEMAFQQRRFMASGDSEEDAEAKARNAAFSPEEAV
jgi:hypothetical protein